MEDALYAALLALPRRTRARRIQDACRAWATIQAFSPEELLALRLAAVALEYWLDEYETLSRGQQQQVAQPSTTACASSARPEPLRRIISLSRTSAFRQICWMAEDIPG